MKQKNRMEIRAEHLYGKIQNIDMKANTKIDDRANDGIIVLERSRTDILCWFIFALFIPSMMAIGLYAFVLGDYAKVIVPHDADLRMCGI